MKHDIRIKESNGVKKVIGVYDDITNEFTTQRNGSKHLLRKYNAWAIDKKLVETLLVPKKALIVIQDTKAKKEYRISSEEFMELSSEITYYEHREQLYLHRDRFQVLKMSV